MRRTAFRLAAVARPPPAIAAQACFDERFVKTRRLFVSQALLRVRLARRRSLGLSACVEHRKPPRGFRAVFSTLFKHPGRFWAFRWMLPRQASKLRIYNCKRNGFKH